LSYIKTGISIALVVLTGGAEKICAASDSRVFWMPGQITAEASIITSTVMKNRLMVIVFKALLL
jgi:hypothetical protein